MANANPIAHKLTTLKPGGMLLLIIISLVINFVFCFLKFFLMQYKF